MPKLTRAQFLQAAALLPFLLEDVQAQTPKLDAVRARTGPWREVYHTTFGADFEVTDTGTGRAGKPCWRSDFAYGGRIVNNGETGVYADPVVFPGTNPFPLVEGKRRLRSERLTKPIRWKGQSYSYSAALMSAPHLPVGPGGRVECRMSLPHVMRKGYWLGFWLLPIKTASERNWPWPPELDVIEWWLYNEGDKPTAFWNSLHTGTATTHRNDPKQVSLPSLGIAGDLTRMLTYGVEITDAEIVCFVNDKEISRRSNPAPARQWYPVLDLAVAGDPWPGAPKADTQFPQEVILDHLRILKRI